MPQPPITDFAATTRRPADFDQFWDATFAELRSVPPDITCTADPLRSTETVATFAVGFTSLEGARIFAWLCLPREQIACPGLLLPPGYSGSPSVPRAWATLGYVALQVSPRGHHRSDSEVAPGFPGYMTAGIEGPRTYVYRGAYCDVYRATDVLLARPEVDHDRLGVSGASQGGALSLIGSPFRRC